MGPTQFHDTQHAKRDSNAGNGLCPPRLKISKDSHLIKKSTSSSSSLSPSSSCSSTSLAASSIGAGPVKPPHPVIIYTHSPKIIHTHPKDFMALVQKLTGLSRSDENPITPTQKPENISASSLLEEDCKSGNNKLGGTSDDNDSSSVITDDHCGSVGEGQVNSCFVGPPIFDPPPASFLTNLPVFTPNPADHFLSRNRPFYNYADSFFFPHPNMRGSISSSSSALDGVSEFPEYSKF